jgi:L-histidine Nalpha-methyltransferase
MAVKSPAVLVSPIAEEVLRGLSARPRRLPPKLFYDAAGSRIFEQITETPEYYPTRTERAILKKYEERLFARPGQISRWLSWALAAPAKLKS